MPPDRLAQLDPGRPVVEQLRERVAAMERRPMADRIPTLPGLTDILPLHSGATYAVDSASLAFAVAAGASRAGEWVGFAGCPDFGVEAAAELGMELSRTVLVPEPGEHWDAVFDLSGEEPPLEDVEFYVHWLIEDGPAPDLDTLVALADLVRSMRAAGKRVLVHCAAGINRSGLLAAASLIREGYDADDAIGTVRAARTGALNNPEFVEALRSL